MDGTLSLSLRILGVVRKLLDMGSRVFRATVAELTHKPQTVYDKESRGVAVRNVPTARAPRGITGVPSS